MIDPTLRCDKTLKDCLAHGDDVPLSARPVMHPRQFGAFPALPNRVPDPDWKPTPRELLVGDALDKAWVLAQLVRDEFAHPPERVRNAADAFEDARRALLQHELPICAGDRPGGGA